jgi:hypothetical protein
MKSTASLSAEPYPDGGAQGADDPHDRCGYDYQPHDHYGSVGVRIGGAGYDFGQHPAMSMKEGAKGIDHRKTSSFAGLSPPSAAPP